MKFRYRLTWSDVDYARVAYYPRFGIWVDEAFHGHLYARGCSLVALLEQGYGLPYIATSCRYLRKLTLEDEVEIALSITKSDAKGFTLAFTITKAGDDGPAAEGEQVRRCISGDPPKSTAMPPQLRSVIDELAASSR